MRVLTLTATVVLAAAAAQAASIDEITTGRAEHSIERISCAECPPLRSRIKKAAPEVMLEPGTQKIEIREVGGVRKIYRTEAWMGGSPVVFVTKAPKQETGNSVADAEAKEQDTQPDGMTVAIDKEAKTSAVSASMSGKAQSDKPAETSKFKPDGLELRLK